MQRLNDTVNLGLRDASAVRIVLLKENHLDAAVVGIEVYSDSILMGLRVALLKSLVGRALQVEDSAFCRL